MDAIANIPEKASAYLADCVDAMRDMEPGTVDLACCDPPYNINQPIVGDDSEDAAYLDFTRRWIAGALRVLKDNGTIYVMCSLKYQPYIHLIMKDEFNLFHLNTVIWAYAGNTHASKYRMTNTYEPILAFVKDEGNYTFNMDDMRDPFAFSRMDKKNHPKGKALADVWDDIPWYGIAHGTVWGDIDYLRWNHPERYRFYDKRTKRNKALGRSKKGHPTQKPKKLFSRMILLSSNPGDLVLDPFAGTGSCAVACLDSGRRYVGYEIDDRWVDVIKTRMESASSKKLSSFVGKGLDSFAGGDVP